MEKQTKERFKIVALFIIVIVACVIAGKGCKKVEPEKVTITDTVYVDKIKIVKIETPSKPEKIYIQSKPDIIYRKVVEKQIITIGTSFEDGKLKVQTIDSSGKIQQADFNIMLNDSFKITNEGDVEIEHDPVARRKERIKKVLRTAKDIALVVGGFILGAKL
jgi:hypothetical protein